MFKQKIEELLKENGINKRKLALDTSIPYTTINGWLKEDKNPTLNNLITLADYFQCSIDFLSGRENDYGIIQSINEHPKTTLNEMELLEAFRSLDEDEQQAIIQTAKIMQKAKEKQK